MKHHTSLWTLGRLARRCAPLLLAASLPAAAASSVTLTPELAGALAKDAYVYAYPLVKNYLSLYQFALDAGGSQYKGPPNQVNNVARVFTPQDTGVITPNSDTPYSFLVLDLRAEPIVVTLPRIEDDRYYSLQLVDLYTHNVDYIGTRRDGNGGGSFLLAGPDWQGEVPPRIRRMVRFSTQLGFSQFRTQLRAPEDLDAVKAIQAGYRAVPLSTFLGTAPPPAPPTPAYPGIDDERFDRQFWQYANFLLQFSPPLESERALRRQFAAIGLQEGAPWPKPGLSDATQAAIEEGTAAGRQTIEESLGRVTSSAGLFGSPDRMAGKYLERAMGAMGGIYGNDIEETLYPSYMKDAGGQALDTSRHDYVMVFPAGQLPPVDAFWSVTVYDAATRLLVDNPLQRYLINSPMLEQLQKDADGGITLHLQHASPGPQRESNWLPAPDGPMSVVMRLYLPRQEALAGTWQAPQIQIAGDTAAPAAEPATHPLAAFMSGAAVPVTPDNFVRAETDLYFGNVVLQGGLGRFDHTREVAPLDKQTVIRLNRDTLYSAAVLDLDAGPATVTLPDGGGRFVSLQVIDQDQYTHGVHYQPGTYELRREDIGTRYAVVAARILVDPADSADVAAARALQDGLELRQRAPGRFEIPRWDPVSQGKVREALLALAATLPDTQRMYGRKDEVDPVRFLIGAAQGWGANPPSEAMYLNVVPAANDGRTPHMLRVGEVPVDGFWSISVYNAQGYYEPNELGRYSLNDITAQREPDGSIQVRFGGCEAATANCLPIVEGWNYMVRLYRPRPEILDGSWTFPQAEPAR